MTHDVSSDVQAMPADIHSTCRVLPIQHATASPGLYSYAISAANQQDAVRCDVALSKHHEAWNTDLLLRLRLRNDFFSYSMAQSAFQVCGK